MKRVSLLLTERCVAASSLGVTAVDDYLGTRFISCLEGVEWFKISSDFSSFDRDHLHISIIFKPGGKYV